MSQKTKLDGDLIGLDLGKVRTGTARINTNAKIYEPLKDLDTQADLIGDLANLIKDNKALAVVVGVPRGLNGQTTNQTLWVQSLIVELENSLEVPIFTIDEAGTTKEAENIAKQGQSIDGVAAGIMLHDFLEEVRLGRVKNVSL